MTNEYLENNEFHLIHAHEFVKDSSIDILQNLQKLRNNSICSTIRLFEVSIRLSTDQSDFEFAFGYKMNNLITDLVGS